MTKTKETKAKSVKAAKKDARGRKKSDAARTFVLSSARIQQDTNEKMLAITEKLGINKAQLIDKLVARNYEKIMATDIFAME